MYDDEWPADADSSADRAPKLLSPPQPVLNGQHADYSRGAVQVRPRVEHGPCGGEQRRSRGRRGYACAAGNHAYAPGGGCWAGRCASRCMLRIYGGQSVMDRRPPGTRAPKRTASWRFVGPIYGTRRRPTGSNWALPPSVPSPFFDVSTREPTTVPGGRYQIEVDTPSNDGILWGSVDERRSPC